MIGKLWTLGTVFSLAVFFSCGGEVTEEDTECEEGETRDCGSEIGTCEQGHQTCNSDGEWGECRGDRGPDTEICDGLDNDCDGNTDEGVLNRCGECGSTPEEVCDGVDNDCDGYIDEVCPCFEHEGETQPCGSGACRGHEECYNGEWTDCSSLGESCGPCDCFCVENEEGEIVEEDDPQREVCDMIDNDCDGETDEGCECRAGETRTCGTDVGECETGLQVCGPDYSWSEECHDEVEPVREICNDLDDDCDNRIDESFACRIGEEEECRTSCGTTGSHICGDDCQWPPCEPPRESCNGRDDNCDGRCDEGYSCCAHSTRSCTTSCGSTGSQECSIFCGWPSRCSPPVESCNGEDDDCDGACDEEFTCCAGDSTFCRTSCGTEGIRVCTDSCEWDAICRPPLESCNNRDDDCDEFVDEGFTCRQGSISSCTTSCGSEGIRTCSIFCAWGSCEVPEEECNGRDDDCDGSIDETFTCRQLSSRDCLTSCGTWGTQLCNPFCTWGICTPPSERCNGRDDDCDESVDEGFTCRVGSTRSCTTSCGSIGVQTCNSSCAWGGCVPPSEACNGRDDNCDGTIDEGCCFDRDGDGYEGESDSCPDGDDCDDSRTSVYPDALEVCDGRDNDCDDRSDNLEDIEVISDSNTYYVIDSCSTDPCCRRATHRTSGRIYRVNFPRATLDRIDPARIVITVVLYYKYYSNTAYHSARIEFMLYNTAGSRISNRSFTFTSPRDSSCSTSTGFAPRVESYSLSGHDVSHLDIYVYTGDYGVKVKDLSVSIDPSCG